MAIGFHLDDIEEAYFREHGFSTEDAIATTPEYFAKELADESNVQKVVDLLESHGIQVKTKYGYYRPTYDVLKDIGEFMSRYKE